MKLGVDRNHALHHAAQDGFETGALPLQIIHRFLQAFGGDFGDERAFSRKYENRKLEPTTPATPMVDAAAIKPQGVDSGRKILSASRENAVRPAPTAMLGRRLVPIHIYTLSSEQRLENGGLLKIQPKDKPPSTLFHQTVTQPSFFCIGRTDTLLKKSTNMLY